MQRPVVVPAETNHVLSGLDPTGYNYHVLEVARLSGPLNLDALEASIATICERHEVLRSTFREGTGEEEMGEPVQTVGTAVQRLEHLDLRPCARTRRAAAIERQGRELLANPSISQRSRRSAPSFCDSETTTMRW